MTSDCRRAEILHSLQYPWILLQECYSPGQCHKHITPNSLLSDQSNLTKETAASKISAIKSLRKSSFVQPWGVTATSAEAD